MPQKELVGLRIAILATDGFEEKELTVPRKALEQAGATTLVIAPKLGKIQGMNHDEKADQTDVDLTVDQANPDDFDGLLLPGGALNADHLRVVPKAKEFVRSMDRAEKPIAVICHGAWILASAGLTKGRTLTSYHTIQDDLSNAGAIWVDQEVVCDRNWVSSRQPSDLPAFNREMLALFAERKARRKQATAS